jgi:hypothetical protein
MIFIIENLYYKDTNFHLVIGTKKTLLILTSAHPNQTNYIKKMYPNAKIW